MPKYTYGLKSCPGVATCNDNGRGLMFGVEVNCQNNSTKRKAVLADVVSTVLRFYLTQIAVTASSLSIVNIRFVLAIQMVVIVRPVESGIRQHSVVFQD